MKDLPPLLKKISSADFCQQLWDIASQDQITDGEVRNFIKNRLPSVKIIFMTHELKQLHEATNPVALATLAHHNPEGLMDIDFMINFQRRSPKIPNHETNNKNDG